ncbi:hypothetical protein BGW37DRAFT_402128, partial [Umbelopsis sp. PMI_123]
TPELAERAKRRDRYYRRWQQAIGLDKITWWERYHREHQEFRSDVRRTRRQAYRAFCAALERDFSKASSKIKAIRRRRQQPPTFSHPHGPAAAAETMSRQLASTCDGSFLPSARPEVLDPPATPFPIDDCPFGPSSIMSAIKRLPKRKAPGADHLQAEMLKPIVKPLTAILVPLFQLCWQWSFTPPQWRHAQVCPLFKKGDPSLPSNYRPISLTSILRKAIEYCLAP